MLAKVNIGAFLRDELPRDSQTIKMGWSTSINLPLSRGTSTKRGVFTASLYTTGKKKEEIDLTK